MSRERIAIILKKLREKSGLTINQVGALLGKSGKTISAWENNHGQPDAEMLMKLCDIYGVKDILSAFREDSADDQLTLTARETAVITAYRNNPAMQPAVDRLLGLNFTECLSIADDIKATLNAPIPSINTGKK